MKLSFCSFTLLLSLPIIAQAQEGFYLSTNIGISSPLESDATHAGVFRASNGNIFPFKVEGTAHLDKGYALNLAIGHSWGALRIEGELGYTESNQNKVDSDQGTYKVEGKSAVKTLMLNAAYDIPVSDKHDLVVYPLIGIGYSRLESKKVTLEDYTFDGHKEGVAWQVGAGIGYTLSSNIRLNFQYRYVSTSKEKWQDLTGDRYIELKYEAHQIFAGLSYAF